MSRGCARCSSPSNRRPCPASCRPAQPGAQQSKARLAEPGGFVGPAQEEPPPACPLLPGVHLGCARVTGCNSPHGFPLLKRCIGLFLHLFITVAFPREATLGGRAELVGEPPGLGSSGGCAQALAESGGERPTPCSPPHPYAGNKPACSCPGAGRLQMWQPRVWACVLALRQ